MSVFVSRALCVSVVLARALAQPCSAFSSLAAGNMQAVVVTQFGGPSVLKLETVARPVPAKGQVLVNIKSIGVNPVEVGIVAHPHSCCCFVLVLF